MTPKYRLVINDITGRHEFYVGAGLTLMDAVIKQGYKVDSVCGGNKTCGKCRAILKGGQSPTETMTDPQTSGWGLSPTNIPGPTPEELALLRKHNAPADERLMCFIPMDRDMEITLPHQSAQAQIMIAGLKTENTERDPWVKKARIEVDPSTLTDQRGFAEALMAAVPGTTGISLNALIKTAALLTGKSQTLEVVTLDQEIVDVNTPVQTLTEESQLNHPPGSDPTGHTAGHPTGHPTGQPISRPVGPFGAAIDIGTTTLAAYLYDYGTDEITATASALNPQAVRGKDVMTRLHYAASNKDGATELSRRLIAELNTMLHSLASQAGIDRADLLHVVTTGNTTMQQLLLGVNCGLMGISPFLPMVTHTLTTPAAHLGLSIHPDGRLTVLPSKAAFVGADTLSAVYAAGLHQQPEDKVQLLIDIGTNGEIVLSGRGRMLCCATAAGPAFEGGSISCGMGGVSGAIDKVDFSWPCGYTTIGGVAPKGLCGSGLIDFCAELLREGKLSRPGRLLERDENDRYFLDEAAGIFLSQKDVRELQLAKGAIHAAVEILMGMLGIGPEEIDQVDLAGGFGSFLNLESAEEIKLLPKGLMSRARVVGNAAGMGAVAALRSKEALKAIEAIKEKMEYVELSGLGDFQQAFIMKLGF
ncbi:ASKHA domain-containing protein [Acidaminobacter hydrogenoformans]|uniref:2Fe-2S ferredoxin-type domain-containing protein n=1 Tax=Acidaminobacter hydrogenoformans DSM 2784 TaxID=1120920 RepID=A0A1G5RWL0_9FIRM|nr:ASKHA domain-containing protein [Acidaminobacter hydrogenoformans]SCZ78120.1 protein of unknown function [Acidaminobacter hydrogenoformans DSM 2784]